MERAQLLIVEDDRLILHTLSRGLCGAGYRTLQADSGEAAMKIAREHAVDLAIIDFRMPGMSGLELAAQLRAQFATPCIFLSAYGDSAIVKQAVAEGALGYLVKPLDVPSIVPSIQTAVVRARELSDLKATRSQLDAAVHQARDTSIAIGMLMERHGLGREQAFELLRKTARQERRKLGELAAELISGKGEIGKKIRDAVSDRSKRPPPY